MNILLFLKEYGLLILSAIITIVSIFITLKNSESKKGFLNLLSLIPPLVIEAENMFGSGKGANKLNWVLTQLRIRALENNVKVSDTELTAHIENVVNATNNVNTNKVENVSSKIPSTNTTEDSTANTQTSQII